MPDAPTLFPEVVKTATISACGRYRYDLTRRWADGDDWAVWVMLNPSTADAEVDDPTIRRCIAFTKREGFGGMAVVNLYAYRATDPRELTKADDAGIDPFGPFNLEYLIRWSDRATLQIAAWGIHGSGHGNPLRFRSKRFHCLGKTKDGCPRHPLYVRADQPLEVWP